MRAVAFLPLLVGASFALLGACSDDGGGDGNQAGSTAQGGEGGTDPVGGKGGKPSTGGNTSGGSKPSTAGSDNGGKGGNEGEGGEGNTNQGGEGPVFTTPRGSCAFDKKIGEFKTEAQVDFGIVNGSFTEAPIPTSIPELVAEESGCMVLKRRNLACFPACVGIETCGEEGTCIPYPRDVNAGVVTIAGLTKATTMEAKPPGAKYFSPGADNPPYEPGSKVALTATGSDTREGFQMFGVGSNPLTEGPTWLLEKGKDLALNWEAPTGDYGTQVYVVLTIDQHGNSPLSLSCELPDTGEGAIPAKLVDQMINSGVSGFPNGRIVRRTIDKVELDIGCVEFSVGSAFAAKVRVDGFTPCKTPNDCPDGQTCNTEQEICE